MHVSFEIVSFGESRWVLNNKSVKFFFVGTYLFLLGKKKFKIKRVSKTNVEIEDQGMRG